MLKRLTIALALIFGLVLLDSVSSFFVVRPCLIEQVVKNGSEQKPQANEGDRGCVYQGGLVVEGIAIASEWKPEIWTAISTVVIAAFTTILGLFTISLAKSTRIAAEAADLTARAAIALELPIIRIQPQKETYGTTRRKGEQKESHHITIGSLVFSNLGNTKAFPIEIEYGWTAGRELPKSPVYRRIKTFDAGYILDASRSSAPEIDLPDADIEIPENGYDQIGAGDLRVWFYCRLSYLDFMEQERSVSFCWQRYETLGRGGFRVDDTPAYNQKT